ncbi:MAG: hypothetical protein K1X89_00195 [Myxococcaceae bacterium]|nr:hypothetical protein [Myxococcaceae bacterium]
MATSTAATPAPAPDAARAASVLASPGPAPLVSIEDAAPVRSMRDIVQGSSLGRLKHLAKPFLDGAQLDPPAAGELRTRLEALGPGASRLTAVEAATALGHTSWAPGLEALGFPRGQGRSYLLAAKLTLFMERSFRGATVDELGALFARATPGAEATFGAIDGDYVRALQKAYPFMPQWQTSPGPKVGDDDWLSGEAVGDTQAERLQNALEELNEISFDMPITRSVGERYAEEKPLAKANVVMVQHVLGQASGLVRAMTAAGLDPAKAEFVGIPYQQGHAVEATVEAESGMPMEVPPLGDIDAMWKCIGEAIDRAVERHRENGEPIVVLDDGGYASKYIVEKYPELQSAFRVVEQTTRGLTEISALTPGFPVVNVAGSYGKRLESAQIGEAIISSVSTVLSALATGLNNRAVLVVGAGKVGTETARAARAHGAKSVAVYDPYLTPQQRKALEAEGFRVITDKAEALKDKFLVVGTSGHRSIDLEDFTRLASGDPDRPVFIAQGSSKRVEIDHVGLLSQSTDAQGRLRRVLAAKVNDQETYHYWLNDGRLITALANDLPVNFQSINSVAPADIDHVMALMLTGAVQALRSTGSGLEPLDEAAQFRIQAQGAGLSEAPPLEGQVAVTVGGRSYAGSLEQWAELARSVGTPPLALAAIHGAFADAPAKSVENRISLDCLGAPHELSNAMLDQVLQQVIDDIELRDQAAAAKSITHPGRRTEFLPALERLVANDALTEEQRAQVSDLVQERLRFVQDRSFRTQLRGPQRPADAPEPRGNASVYEGVRVGSGGRGPHTSLLMKLALTDPRLPQAELTPFLKDPSVLQHPTPVNVFLVKNPRLSSAELDTLASRAFDRLDLARTFASYSRYLFDLTESFAAHPNASSALRERMAKYQALIESLAQGTPLGSDLWPHQLGTQLPQYQDLKGTPARMDAEISGLSKGLRISREDLNQHLARLGLPPVPLA